MRNRLTAEGAMIRGHPPGLAEIEKFVCSLIVYILILGQNYSLKCDSLINTRYMTKASNWELMELEFTRNFSYHLITR